MLAEIDSDELLDWEAFYIVEPFGEEWGQTARLCGEFARVMTGELPPRSAYMPVQEPEQIQSFDQIGAALMAASVPGKQ